MNIERITGTFRALKNRNYRLFFTGQGISLIGTWMQQVAVSWLIYRLTGSAFMLGAVSFCTQVPSLIIFPLAGILADRLDRRRLLIATQLGALLQAFFLAVLVVSGTIAVWHIIGLSIFMGIVNAFDMPVRQSFVVEMVDRREDLGNAIALNSTLFNGARLIGPTAAGVIISLLGEGACFLINAVSYIAVIAALMRISVSAVRKYQPAGNTLSEIIAGTKYTFGFPPIRSIIILLAVISFAGMPYMVLMPVFAKTVLHGDANTLGLLTGFGGMGALAGALYLASRQTVVGLERLISVSAVSFGICLCLFSVSGILPLSLALVVLTGFSIINAMASSNTLIQTIVKDSMRGRVMAFFNVAFFGFAPFGSIAAGSLTEIFGPKLVVFACGCITILGALIFTLGLPRISKIVHHVYVRKGIIPEIAIGLQDADSATELQKE